MSSYFLNERGEILTTKFFEQTKKIDSIMMFFVYTLSMLTEIAYIYVLQNREYWMSNSEFFTIFYIVTSGIIITLNVFLLISLYRKKHSWLSSMRLLLTYAVVQFTVIIVDIIYTSLYGDFWVDGYLFVILESLFIVASLWRYFTLKKTKEYILQEIGGMENG